MAAQTFDTVWYLPHENRWRDLNVLAYRDVGKLTVSDNLIEFRGKNETVTISNPLRVSYGKQGRDFVNNWVKVEYGDSATPSAAFFAKTSMIFYELEEISGQKEGLVALPGIEPGFED